MGTCIEMGISAPKNKSYRRDAENAEKDSLILPSLRSRRLGGEIFQSFFQAADFSTERIIVSQGRRVGVFLS